MLLTANYENREWRGIIVKRGELVTSIEKLATNTRLSNQQTRTAISKLKSTNEITITTTPNYSLIKLNNYETYQQATNKITANQQTNNKQPNKQSTNNQQTTNNKQELKNKENIYKEGGHLKITWDEFNKLADKYGIEKADDMIDRVLNYRKNSKYKSLYLTANKWLEKEQVKKDGRMVI